MSIINLLTIHWGCSYGAILQTYATIKLLEENGHQVNVINLKHPNSKFIENHKSKSSFLNIIRELQFLSFKKQHFPNLTKCMYSLKAELIPNADYYVVGSDQVWNSAITGPLKMAFFLDFVGEDVQKISLSSSFGTIYWNETEQFTNDVRIALSQFKAVSVRESDGVDILKNVFAINGVQLLDPTLAYGKFDNLVKSISRKKQLFPFLLKHDIEQYAICKELSEYLKIPLYKMTRINLLFDRSISSWLCNIRNSDFIITDSFHGLAFCLLFHKQFVVLCADTLKFSRLTSLLSLVGLENRYVRSVDDLTCRLKELSQAIDYDKVDAILARERAKCAEFISMNIA